jgi:hypothetical protein
LLIVIIANLDIMTTVIIQSDSEKKTHLLMQLAEELGLSAQTQNFKELTATDMAKGIGRKATDEELIAYLNKGINDTPIHLDTAFSKYAERNNSWFPAILT